MDRPTKPEEATDEALYNDGIGIHGFIAARHGSAGKPAGHSAADIRCEPRTTARINHADDAGNLYFSVGGTLRELTTDHQLITLATIPVPVTQGAATLADRVLVELSSRRAWTRLLLVG